MPYMSDFPNTAITTVNQVQAAREVRSKIFTCPSRRTGAELSRQDPSLIFPSNPAPGQVGTGGENAIGYYQPGAVSDYAGNTGNYGTPDGMGAYTEYWWSSQANGVIVGGTGDDNRDGSPFSSQISLTKIPDGTSNTFLWAKSTCLWAS
jgi:hypothetical protein